MNYREARQIKDGPNVGRWHYTNMRDGKIWADGACRNGCPGHDTAEEAYEHERQRLIAAMEIVELSPDERAYSPGRCEAPDELSCTRPATHRIVLPFPNALYSPRLCKDHAVPAVAERLVVSGPSVASW